MSSTTFETPQSQEALVPRKLLLNYLNESEVVQHTLRLVLWEVCIALFLVEAITHNGNMNHMHFCIISPQCFPESKDPTAQY